MSTSRENRAFNTDETRTTENTEKTEPVGAGEDVWSVRSTPPGPVSEAPQRPVRHGTLLWGLILLVVGGILIAVGMGVRVDLGDTAIAVLAGLGVVLLLVSLLPHRDTTR